jgi:hypothetical protein
MLMHRPRPSPSLRVDETVTAAAGVAQGTRPATKMCSNFVWAISARPELICESGKALTTDIRRSFEDFNDLFLCHSSPKSLPLAN